MIAADRGGRHGGGGGPRRGRCHRAPAPLVSSHFHHQAAALLRARAGSRRPLPGDLRDGWRTHAETLGGAEGGGGGGGGTGLTGRKQHPAFSNNSSPPTGVWPDGSGNHLMAPCWKLYYHLTMVFIFKYY